MFFEDVIEPRFVPIFREYEKGYCYTLLRIQNDWCRKWSTFRWRQLLWRCVHPSYLRRRRLWYRRSNSKAKSWLYRRMSGQTHIVANRDYNLLSMRSMLTRLLCRHLLATHCWEWTWNSEWACHNICSSQGYHLGYHQHWYKFPGIQWMRWMSRCKVWRIGAWLCIWVGTDYARWSVRR